jgi:transposase
MSLRAPVIYCLPEDTARVARAAFPKGNAYLRVFDALGPIYTNPQFANLFPTAGQPAVAPAQLALATIFQFAEGLSDRQAVDTLLGVLRELGLVKARGRQRTDSTHVLAAVQVLNRLEFVGEALRHALNALATVAPDWLRAQAPAAWFDRYGQRFAEYRLPDALAARTALAEQIGADGRGLLAAVYAAEAPAWLRDIPAVETLRRAWVQQFHAGEPARWRDAKDLPPAARLISTPYDPEARYSAKRSTHWTGNKVHLTETCDDDTPPLLTDVTTTTAPSADSTATATIQARLAARDLLPQTHLVDSGYVTADRLVTSTAQYGCDLLGPIHADASWQARAATGYAQADFALDWDAERATCPQGKASMEWKPATDSAGRDVIRVRFAPADCGPCQVRPQCNVSPRARMVMIRPCPQHEALLLARRRQHTAAFKAAYRRRAGIEGTVAQGVGLGDLRRTRYRGLAKTRLLQLLIATALNFVRLAAWLIKRPRAQARVSAFARLAPAM